MRRLIIAPLATVLMITPASAAQCLTSPAAEKSITTSVLSLKRVLELTLENDQRIEAARFGIDMARHDLSDAKSFYRPKISGIGRLSVNDRPTLVQQSITGAEQRLDQDGTSYYGGLEVSQNIYGFGRYAALIGKNKAAIEQNRYHLKMTEQEALLEAIFAYLDYGSALARHKAFEAYSADMRDLVKRTKDKFDNQLIGRGEFMLVRSRLQQAKASLNTNKISTTRAFQRLAKLINKQDFDINVQQFPTYERFLPKTLNEAIDRSQEYDPRVKAAQELVKIKQLEAKYSKAQSHPQISLSASVVRGQGQLEERSTQEAVVGLNLSMPLYDGGSTRSKTRRAKSATNQANALLVDEVASAEERVTAAWKIYESLQVSELTWAKAYDAEMKAVEEIKQEVDNQLSSLIVLLEAREQLVQTEVNKISSVYEKLKSGYELLTYSGKLTDLLKP
ncbi:TolC family protein [Temperatibacter marinus]|uniref:TolC family protein n=1 Tax=Temperatibacter marinus TaxID=1456591 RepID=A0AA52EG40_9PROT|nr:TolC family protein [Temperatibacter marinus]WND03043.1 TolC family protein [Temperatibacter marinus]